MQELVLPGKLIANATNGRSAAQTAKEQSFDAHNSHLSTQFWEPPGCLSLAVSICVNPAQFGPTEDYASYPRDVDADYARLDEAGVDLVLAPTTDEIYPAGSHTQVDVGRLSERLEGASRPGHFVGVATVVTKLLSIVRPDTAYFGQKDAQQGLVIWRLNADLNLGAQVVLCPIVREADGLALSSRNASLSADERQAATVLYKALSAAGSMETDNADQVRRRMRAVIEEEPLADLDYVSVANPQTLDELDTVTESALALVAVRIGKTRLIDNMAIGSKA